MFKAYLPRWRTLPRGADDDQLADRAGISSRQGVNQICRELERAGLVRRRPGADGKIVNEWLGGDSRQPAGVPGPAGAGVAQAGALAGGVAVGPGPNVPTGSSH